MKPSGLDNSSMKLESGFETERVVRNRQDRTRTTNDRLWAGFRSRVNSSSQFRAEAFIEDRGGSDYEVRTNTNSQQNPGFTGSHPKQRTRFT